MIFASTGRLVATDIWLAGNVAAMPTPATIGLLALAALLLAVLPGPAVLYIVNRSIAQGRRAGVVSALGIATGALVHVTAAALGVSAVLATSALAFSVVKYAGAAYLIFLGLRTLRRGDDIQAVGLAPDPHRRIYSQGVVVNVLNPKTALFFLSFLPQFVDPDVGPALPQLLTLGAVFIVVALASDLTYALASAAIGLRLEARPGARRARRWVSATVLCGLGVTAATQ